MKEGKSSNLLTIVAVFLILVLATPSYVSAANTEPVAPCASYYLDSYSAYTYPAGNGKIEVYFDVTGVHYMDEIGALSIQIYESTNNSTWTFAETFLFDQTPGMLGYNDVYHAGHVTYQGTPGKYYKAYLCIWAGKNGTGDSRYFWTSSKLAT